MDLGIANESLFIHAFEKAPIGMALVSPEGDWLKVNSALCKITGYSKQELLSTNFQSITHKDDLEDESRLTKQTLEGKIDNFQLLKRYYHKQGHIVWVILNVSLVRENAGKPLYFIVQIQDITDYKNAEMLLLQNQQRYKSLIEHYPDLVLAISLDGDILIVNDACEKVTGYTKEEISRIKPILLGHETGLYRKQFQLAIKGQPQEFEDTMVHKQGHLLNLRITYVPIIVDEKIEGVYSIIKDVTQYKKATERLLYHEEIYELISKHARDVILYSTPDGITNYVSPAIKSILGYEPEEWIGKSSKQFWHPDDANDFDGANIFHSSDFNIFSYRVRHKESHYVWIETTVKAIRDEHGALQYILEIGRDITERRRLEEERKEAQQMMLNSEKLSVAGQLAAGIAHEIRNPLTAIKGFLKLLERKIDHEKPHYFEVIGSEINRIELIINELLILTKPQAAEYEVKDVRVILEQVILLMESQALMENLEINRIIDDTELVVLCEENKLKQVFINIMKNAMESMDNGGEIIITARKDGDKINITLTDQGCGIPEEQLSKLGEPFYTTKEKGTGLGFMVSKKIIESHNGTIHVSSKINEGTKVEITLPACNPVQKIK
ncbi:PAS domain-containing sensor histidine kinase [Paenibacillus alkalitolerans]|uniref:PAS domain-containing sensor histidine kinase n=1 Tax=Paenibacillus alkalitolerans TaxID=2799335 RepID=UPI0018F3A91B|nr:PAS domain-containing sensor histidine kinase [Paenibacillus alkalitolerans]